MLANLTSSWERPDLPQCGWPLFSHIPWICLDFWIGCEHCKQPLPYCTLSRYVLLILPKLQYMCLFHNSHQSPHMVHNLCRKRWKGLWRCMRFHTNMLTPKPWRELNIEPLQMCWSKVEYVKNDYGNVLVTLRMYGGKCHWGGGIIAHAKLAYFYDNS